MQLAGGGGGQFLNVFEAADRPHPHGQIFFFEADDFGPSQ
jgi:hypothetical protein